MLSIFSLLVSALPTRVFAGMRGEMELGFVDYKSSINGQRLLDGNSFYQRYSAQYESAGFIVDRRVGAYQWALGYEWGSFDTSIKTGSSDFSPSRSSGHLLFDGEVKLDPRELPLRFRAYSRDLNRMTFVSDSIAPIFTTSDGRMVQPNLVTDLLDGSHILSGATLILGVKNGATNGYNAVFREIPMVLFDYKDEIHKDLNAQTPIDYRVSRLAFVSLNKKENWVHYRHTAYRNNLDHSTDYNEDQYQIGTVDHTLTRRWVNLTNWIRLSTDLLLTTHDLNGQRTQDSYEYNLFLGALRQNWEANFYGNFYRNRSTSALEYITKLPLYASGKYSNDTDWRAGIKHETRRLQDYGTGITTTSRDTLISGGVETFKNARFTLREAASLELYNEEDRRLTTAESTTEAASTKRFSEVYGLQGSYALRYTSSSSQAGGDTTNLTQMLRGRITYEPVRTFRLMADQSLTTGSGTQSSVGNSLSPGMADSWLKNNRYFLPPSSDYVRSATSVDLSWQPRPRLTVGGNASYEVLMQSGQSTNQTLAHLKQTVDYFDGPYNFSSILTATDSQTDAAQERSYGIELRAGYRPNQRYNASVNLLASKTTAGDIDYTYLSLAQVGNYYIYKRTGLQRRLLEFSETLEHTRQQSSVNETLTRTGLGLAVRYYPLRTLFLGASARYTMRDPESTQDLVLYGSIGISFAKLQATLDYGYGKRSGSDNRLEKRLSANLKKVF